MKIKKQVMAVWVVVGLWATAGLGQQLWWLGTLGGSGTQLEEGKATGVSDDGQVVVGYAKAADGQVRAFRWTKAGGMEELAGDGGSESRAYGVSSDGRVVVGAVRGSDGRWQAVRWEVGKGMVVLKRGEAEIEGEALGITPDGRVIVGWWHNGGGEVRAFRWSEGKGFEDLGRFSDGDTAVATNVSEDGQVVVGWGNREGEEGERYHRAFRWTEGGGMEDLGEVGGGWSRAYGVSGDGRIVVGAAANQYRMVVAFWWREGTMSVLTDPRQVYMQSAVARDISADGGVVVGETVPAGGFWWTKRSGRVEFLQGRFGELVSDGSVLAAAVGVSRDGRYIVGSGYTVERGRIEPFLLDTEGTVGVVEEGEKDGERIKVEQGAGGIRVRMEGVRGRVRVRVYDYSGRQVWEREAEGSGEVVIEWDGEDGRGVEVSRGIYFWVIECGEERMVVPVVWR